jgi:hypothetical protein
LVEHSLANWQYQSRAVERPGEPARLAMERAYRKDRGIPLDAPIGG